MESEALARKLVRRAKEAMVLVENLQFDIENNDNGTKLEMLESLLCNNLQAQASIRKQLETCDKDNYAAMDISFEHPEPANYTSIGSIQLEKVLAKKPSLCLQSEEERSVMTEITQNIAARLGHFEDFRRDKGFKKTIILKREFLK
ncbi:Oidioi.mRNA.OKI2018_I69.XSR.g14697.t1.cds [Oikopleura dioica]|uniref:Oidioi.mRNA.OKI2018_I69.XSR.g14697.t1.cds n=1 Tax=Oikopleura dioica TaxID=34765 RepID=A0ABN7SFS4_OIKDI|nr:Oidioi.mRNA.OKI2018_I69.XSR.g14697.t1.cds [Oikopleura dioica]